MSVINTATNQVISTIGVGSSPQGLAISPDGTKAYVANGGSNTVSVINTATKPRTKPIDPIVVGTSPQGMAIVATAHASTWPTAAVAPCR